MSRIFTRKGYSLCTVVILLLLSTILILGHPSYASADELWRRSMIEFSYSDTGESDGYDPIFSAGTVQPAPAEGVVVYSPANPEGVSVRGALFDANGVDWISTVDGESYAKLAGEQNFSLVSGAIEGDYVFMLYEDIALVGQPLPWDTNLFRGFRQYYIVPSVTKALHAVAWNDNGVTLKYEFDQSGARLLLPDTSALGVNEGHRFDHASFSHNGRYMLALVDETSLVKIDFATGREKVVKTKPDRFDYYTHPGAISNDGRYVLMGGMPNIIMDTQDCGDDFEYFAAGGLSLYAVMDKCQYFTLDSILEDTMKQSPWAGAGYSFSKDSEYGFKIDTTYDINAAMWSFKFNDVRDLMRKRLDYLALGDSYTSGEGDIGKREDGSSYYSAGTVGKGECHLSTKSYPFLLAEYWELNNSQVQSVACSGAKIVPDFTGGEGDYKGQGNRLIKESASSIAEKRKNALDKFTPGIAQQLDFVREYQPRVVTLTGGGNDVGFADILSYCASSYRLFGKYEDNTCGYARNKQMMVDLEENIDQQYFYNRLAIENIKVLSPDTKVYTIGYPQFIKNDAAFCFRASPLLNNDEIKMVRKGVSRLNNVLKKVARDTGTHYIDIEDSLAGGQICEGSEYMSGPVKVGISVLSVRDNNMYHPNAAGHKKIAEDIKDGIDKMTNYAPVNLPYSYPLNPRTIVRTSIAQNEIAVGESLQLVIPAGLFMAGTNASIDLHSKEVHLGDASINGAGPVYIDIPVKANIAVGLHLLTATGTSNDGRTQQVQQFVYVTSGTPNDKDGDGIIDSEDVCDSISEWYEDGVNVCDIAYGGLRSSATPGVENNLRSSMSTLALDSINGSSGVYGHNRNDTESLIPFKSQQGLEALFAGFSEMPGNKQSPNNWWQWWIAGIILAGVLYVTAYKKSKD